MVNQRLKMNRHLCTAFQKSNPPIHTSKHSLSLMSFFKTIKNFVVFLLARHFHFDEETNLGHQKRVPVLINVWERIGHKTSPLLLDYLSTVVFSINFLTKKMDK